jgi:hypothetical protein
MKYLFLFLCLCGLVFGLSGCVNQSIEARRGNIPWNQPNLNDTMIGVPQSIIDQYNE